MDDGCWGESGTRPIRNKLGPMSSRRPQGVSSHTEGSTKSVPVVFGVETVLRPTAAKKGGTWYRRVVEAAECCMTRWHRDEAESRCLRHTTEDGKSDDKGRGGEGREGQS